MIFQRQKTVPKNNNSLTSLKKVLATLILTLTIGAESSTDVEPGMECGGPLSDTPFTCILSAIEYFVRCTFPTNKLKSDCLLSDCPRLNGLNPLNVDGSVDQKTLNNIVEVLNDCLANTPTICGVSVASTPVVQLGWSLDQLLPTFLSVNGTCVLNPNSGSAVTNLHQTIFSVPAQQDPNGPVTISFDAPNITQVSSWNCSLSISTALIQPLLPVRIELFNFPEMKGYINITVNPTLSIEINNGQPVYKVIRDNSSVNVRVYNFESCTLNLPTILVDLINLSLNQFYRESTATSYAVDFLSTLATQSVGAAIQSCR